MYLINDNGNERIAYEWDFDSTSIDLTPKEHQELVDLFGCTKQTAAPVQWKKCVKMYEKLLNEGVMLHLTPDEWNELCNFMFWRKKDKPAAFKKCGASILAKLEANPPKLKSCYTLVKDLNKNDDELSATER